MMKPALVFCAVALAFMSASASAQLYKWVDANGKVNYTDTPPPPSARTSEKKSLSNENEPVAGGLPYDLAQAVKTHPVTLYTTPNCPPCEEGRATLSRRGVPFTEKTVTTQNDIAQLRQAGGAGQLPLLLVGRSIQQGMEAGVWNNMLSAGGYPETSKLPGSYRNPAPAPAAPAARPAMADAKADAKPEARSAVEKKRDGAESPPPATGNAPPGFRF